MKKQIKSLVAVSLCMNIIFNGFSQGKSNQSFKINQEVIMTGVQTDQDNKGVIRKLYEEGFNTGNFDLVKNLVSEEYSGANGQKGSAQLEDQIKALRTGFPDIKWTIEELVAEGDKVVARSSWKGTHTGPFRTYATTRKAITNTAMAMYQLKNGKIVNIWLETDRLGFLQSIEVVPDNIVPPPVNRN